MFLRPSPPPAELAADCTAGPDYPAGDMPLADLLDTVQAREKAATDCRLKHRGLARWAERVSSPDARPPHDGGRMDH